jgi:hypothetical protein
MHRGLGDAIHVDQSRMLIAIVGTPGFEPSRCERLAPKDHQSQVRQGCLLGERRRHQSKERDRGLIEHTDAFAP